MNDFVANNGWVIPAAPALGTSYISYGTIPSTGNVSIAGAINGDPVLNLPAKYIFVAGNNIDVLNTGNLFGITVELNAGVVAQPTLAAVGGLSNQTVNRIFNVDDRPRQACCFIGTLPGDLNLVAGATGNVTNEGSISAAGTGLGEWITIQAKGNVRSGIQGSGDTQVGLFSDQGIYIDSYSNSSKVELYNVVSGYTTNKTLPFLYVNAYRVGFGLPSGRDDRGAQAGCAAVVDHDHGRRANLRRQRRDQQHDQPHVLAGVNTTDLVIDGSKSVTISKDIGAGDGVYITSGGPLTISGNVISNLDGGGNGGIYIYNNGAERADDDLRPARRAGPRQRRHLHRHERPDDAHGHVHPDQRRATGSTSTTSARARATTRRWRATCSPATGSTCTTACRRRTSR